MIIFLIEMVAFSQMMLSGINLNSNYSIDSMVYGLGRIKTLTCHDDDDDDRSYSQNIDEVCLFQVGVWYSEIC